MDHERPALSDETLEWLHSRRRPGNWIAIRPSDQIPPDIAGWDRTILHMFQIAFTPELEKRLANAEIGDDFLLLAAQMLQPIERAPIIRFNEEVLGISIIRADRPGEKGQDVALSDFKNLVSFDVDESELDCGHFTMFWTGQNWSISFDFRSGRGISGKIIEAAKQFLEVAHHAAINGYARPSVDNLFSACELLSKAHLILHRDSAARAKTHKSVSSALNSWGRMGNISGSFLKVFNRLSKERFDARYGVEASVVPPSTHDFEVVSTELKQLESAVSHLSRKVTGDAAA